TQTSYLSVGPEDDIWLERAVSKNPAAGSSSVAAGSTSAAAPRDSSKRIRKPNSRFSDYEQDEPSRLRKRSSGTAAAAGVNLATANYSDDSLADENYNDKDVENENEFSEEENIGASDLSPAKSKGKKKASAPAVKKAKPPRKMNHQERKEYNNALRGRDGSDDSSSDF
ncbi:unnamed protein product, partial [Tilletia controversa]